MQNFLFFIFKNTKKTKEEDSIFIKAYNIFYSFETTRRLKYAKQEKKKKICVYVQFTLFSSFYILDQGGEEYNGFYFLHNLNHEQKRKEIKYILLNHQKGKRRFFFLE